MFSWLAVTSTEIQLAAGAAGEAMSMLGSFDDAWTECMVICTAAMTRLFLGETAEFEYSVELARQAAERTHDRWTHGLVAIIEAQILLQNGFIADVDRAYADAIDAVGAAGDQFLRTIAITQAAELAEIQGDYDRAIRALEESLPVADQVGFSAQLLAVQARLANLEALRGNLGLASELHSAVLGSDAAVSSPWLRAVSLSGLAMIARRRDDAVAAAQLLDEAWALPRTQAVPLMRTLVLTARGYSADQLGDVKGAMEYQLMSLVTARQLGGGRVIANAFEGLAGAYALAGDGQLAAELLGCADGLRRATGGPMPPAERFDVDRAERRTRALIGDDAFETAFAGAAETDPELLFKRVLQA
jgi:hypothetical protein